MSEENKSLRLFNMPWQIFAVFAAIVTWEFCPKA